MAYNPILVTWTFAAERTQTVTVMPDGCRDVILTRLAGEAAVLVSPLMASPERVPVLQGQEYMGIRLRPGAQIDTEVIRRSPTPGTSGALAELALEAASMAANVSEALSCLAVAESAAYAAHDLGVSLRTLQRHTLKTTGRSPDFWRRLSRARRAARMILLGSSLQDAVYSCRYADQAHMTRDMKGWFGMTPGDIASGRDARGHMAWSLCEPGYDAPETGEHNSIR